ncbi:restriction endonuclease subunit S [Pantoea dispersa]|uniref:restriction endonuclease subunit S n=1 Tax=Pantoea dispersa TaxID=59814 RepID=UPI0024B6E0E1|nr:restriction endonuclease subunit S [Pantoea dispersa]MDI9767192.1 restriction endonuclease subunit S [Pantoea dispersa]
MSAMEQVTVLGKYQPYPEYKDSGIEWVGDIPANWNVSKLRYMFSFNKGLTITKESLKDDGIPCVNYGEVHSKFGFEVDPRKHELKCVDEFYLTTSNESLLKKGDFVFADTSEDIDGSGNFTHLNSDIATFAGYHTIIARLFDKSNYRFFAYLFDSQEFRTQIRHAVKGVKVYSITQAILRGACICLPPADEQRTIAAFLDYETARIDKLIAQQQRLIELLKEKRQAVISHAVTKGLNPDAPMKDSGVEWLGEVPEHWKKVTFKYLLAKTIDNRGRTPPVFDSGIPMLEAKQVDGETLFSSDDFYKFIDLHGHANFIRDDVQENDILFITVGTIGKTCLVPPNAEYVIVQNIVAFRCIQDEVEPSFLLFWLRSTSAKEAMISTNKDSILDSIKVSDFVQSRLFIPPTKEQKSIGQTLKLKLARMDSVSDKAQQAIQLMQERRTALISAAVTGKIDLRGWVAPTEEVSNG